ncbi:MAG: NYN domain-containing protein [Phycisphaerales bacterium]|nr:NYN domain-containing protein [Phycisphaerales bacterium]
MAENRVAAYVDGFNLYYGLRSKGWGHFYWIDPYVLIEGLRAEGQRVVAVKYFTARVRQPDDKRRRQSAYLDALRAVSQVEIIRGKFYRKSRRCIRCGEEWPTFEEKMTDSAIAAHLVADAFLGVFDQAVLVGGDTDIVPAIKVVRRHFPNKRLMAWFPPNRKNQEVADSCHDSFQINGDHLRDALMPDTIEIDVGVYVKRPVEWVYNKRRGHR